MMSLETARLRAGVIAAIRKFFDQRCYLEVDTPLLAPALIPEPHIEVFATEIRSPLEELQSAPPVHGTPPTRNARFLIPSPEVWMKELLVQGFPDIYQLGHCFRNAESTGPQHSPEFTMLEWYTLGADYMDSADLTETLLGYLTSQLGSDLPSANHIRCRPPALRLSVAEAFEEYAGVGPDAFESRDQMLEAARALGLAVDASDQAGGSSYDDTFQRIFLTFVEEKLPRDRPVMLTDYPSGVPTLAEQIPGTPFARRWELYLGGVEVANCYSEERDRGRLHSYIDHAAALKRKAMVPHPPARGFAAFSAAPPCSGVALGVDRLLMALTGVTEIKEVIFSTAFGIFREPKDGRGTQC